MIIPPTLASLVFDWGDAYLLSPVRDRWDALRRRHRLTVRELRRAFPLWAIFYSAQTGTWIGRTHAKIISLDVTIVESGPKISELLRSTDNGCNSTCGTACTSCRS